MNPSLSPSLQKLPAGFDHGGSPKLRLANVLAISSAAALCALLVSCGSKTEISSLPPAQGTNTPSTIPAVKPEFARLIGKWERPDGGYVLEIKTIDATGKIDAGYFNPNPINVSRAAALRAAGSTKVFIELNDVNYPGCTYSLAYDPQTDQLFGQYYQAAMRQTFDVFFARMK